MLSGFWGELSQAGQEVVAFIKTLIENIVSFFYTPGAEGAFGSFTFVGVIALSFLALGLFFGIFRLVRRLIHM